MGYFIKIIAITLIVSIFSFSTPVRATEADTLRLLIWEGHAPQAHVSRFKKQIEEKYGFKVKLHISYVESSDDFYNSIRSGNVDIVMMTHHHYKDKRFKYIQNKLLLPLDLKNIPNFKHVIPALQKAEYLNPCLTA